MKTKRCYLYTRVSTKIQVDGYSLDAQREVARRYADAFDIQIIKEYSDEGKSGKNIAGRPAFTEMLDDITSKKDNIDFVLVFKLSRFGRNAADTLNSLQLMQDYGVNLICIEDGIDSSKEMGKLLISILSAVAEQERENIKVQTMAGREQKAREGKWNGGFAPYGYKLVDGELKIAEDEAEIIREIFDKFVHTTWGAGNICKYLNDNYKKKARTKGSLDIFSAPFVIKVIDNPIYMGKLAYGRRRTEKIDGTRNDFKVKKQDEYPVYEGIHEAIVSEELWELAQEKRKTTAIAPIKKHSLDHEHLLSGIVRCPRCGKGMYGNVNRKKKKDGTLYKDHFYYACKHRTHIDGHPCDYRKQWNQTEINGAVEEVILKLVHNDKFAEALKQKINTKLDLSEIEKEIQGVEKRLRQLNVAKDRVGQQMDSLDIDDRLYDRKYNDLQGRLDNFYADIDEAEQELMALRARVKTLEENRITTENIYQFLLHFDKLYNMLTDIEKKAFLNSFVEEVHIFEAPQSDGKFLKSIKFRFPIPYEGDSIQELSWDKSSTVESQVGKGTKFTVTLPHRIAEEKDFDHFMEKAFEYELDRFQGKRILLAEDNELNAEIAITILQEAGFEVEHAADGIICVDMLEKAEAGYYDLILMDIQMPNMDGCKATQTIRKLSDTEKANISIIAMTANAFDEDKRNAYRAGMNGHLAKPIKIDELMAALTEFLR